MLLGYFPVRHDALSILYVIALNLELVVVVGRFLTKFNFFNR